MIGRDKECFVIMPFSDGKSPHDNKWDDLFDNSIKPAVEQAGLGYRCRRSLNPHGNFMKDIMNHLASAEVTIAVLTELRPNVMYELGVRNALKRKTIMLAEKGSAVPSDLSAFIALFYSTDTQRGRSALTNTLRERLAQLDAQEPESDNPVSDFLWQRAQDISDEWLENKNHQVLLTRLTEVLPSYAFRLGVVLNKATQHINSLIYSNMQSTIRASLTSGDVVSELAETVASKDREQDTNQAKAKVARILANVADRTIKTITQESFLTVDSRPLLGRNGGMWQIAYEQFPTVSDLLDDVWLSISEYVPSMQYGILWAFREPKSGRVLKEMGRTWAVTTLMGTLDSRPLEEVGIRPGMTLEAIPLRKGVGVRSRR
jgi:hypothetical protein